MQDQGSNVLGVNKLLGGLRVGAGGSVWGLSEGFEWGGCELHLDVWDSYFLCFGRQLMRRRAGGGWQRGCSNQDVEAGSEPRCSGAGKA